MPFTMFGRTGLKLTVKSNVSEYLIQKRFKNPKTHWSSVRKQKGATDKALEYFDDLYGNVFGNHWPSMRVALLTQSKYVALVNNYSDTDRIIPYLENLGAMDVRRIFECETKRISESPSKGKKRKKVGSATSANVDYKLEDLKERLEEDEIRNLYPQGADIIDTTRSSSVYDATTRLIEPGLSGGANALYEFVPTTKLKGREDWVPESEHFSYYNTDDDCPIIQEEQKLLEFPAELKVFSFVSGFCDPFPRPKRDSLLGVTDYYLMDGASLLPIIALDLRPGDNFLDMCAAPGGKSLLALQTLYPNIVAMNDSSVSRTNRLKRVMKEFIINFNEKLVQDSYRITSIDGRNMNNCSNIFNKILVDVPCTTDRHSAMEDDNNIFKSNRIQERIKIPELQSSLLASALKLVKVGGTVVYSTCSLSPVQNDGVVHMAIKTVHEQSNKRFSIVDMTKALEPTKVMFRYRSNVLRYGHLIVPYLPDNYGPMYFCKLVRLE